MSLNLSVNDEVQALWIAFNDRPINATEQNAMQIATTTPGFVNPQSLFYMFNANGDLNTMITDFYNNLFDRSPSPSELSYWSNYDYNNNISIGELAWDIMNNASGTDAATLNNRIQAADVFDNTLGQNYTPLLDQTAQNFINSISSSTNVAGITPTTIENYVNNPSSTSLANTTSTTTSTSSTSTSSLTNDSNQIQDLYIAFYGRPADLGGLNYWTNVLANNGDNVQSILQNFANSTEAQNLYGTITPSNVGTVINQIYDNLFNRGVDPTGLQYWTNVYNTYHMSPGVLAYDILQAALAANNTDTQTIENKLQASNVFTDTLGQNYSSSTIPTAHNFIINISSSTDVANITPTSIDSLINNPSSTSSTNTTSTTTSTGSTSPSTTIVMPSNISTLSDNTTLQFNDNYNTSASNGATSTYIPTTINNPSVLNSMNILFDNSHSNNIKIGGLTTTGGVSTINISDTGSGEGGITNTISQLNDNALTNLNLSGTHNIDINSINGASAPSGAINITSTNTAGITIGNFDISNYNSNTPNTFNFTSGNNALENLTIWDTNNQTNNFTFGNGSNTLGLMSVAKDSNVITNNITVGGGSNTINLSDTSTTSGAVQDILTLTSPNQDINHFTSISDYTCTNYISTQSNSWSDNFANLNLIFSNTINPNNANATSITSVNASSDTTLQQALNQAIAATSAANPFAYFNIPDSLVPGNPALYMLYHGTVPSNDYATDTVIVDHSSANTGSTFVPGEDAFVVLVGIPNQIIVSTPGHITFTT